MLIQLFKKYDIDFKNIRNTKCLHLNLCHHLDKSYLYGVLFFLYKIIIELIILKNCEIMSNNLHQAVGSIISGKNFPNCEIIMDKACGGKQSVPLFSTKSKTNMTEYCNVDILILQEGKIKVIIEIDESDIKPTQICGKFLTSALSNYYIHQSKKDIPIGKSDSVLFIQILGTSNLIIDKTSKIEQFRNIEESIQKVLPISDSHISKYSLFPLANVPSVEKMLINALLKHLNP